MDGWAASENLIRWQRVSIAALLLALLVTGGYYTVRLHRAGLALESARRQTAAWREQALQAGAWLQKERDVTEGLKSCMTFDRTYIRSLESRLSPPKRP